jgi:hypothetical protein
MGFSSKQLTALRRNPDHRFVRSRQAHGRELTYLEGWYAVSEANRIFGFDGWSRETVESRCVLARENRGTFTAVYVARIRITVNAGGATLIREGSGTGESHGSSPGEVHDAALKTAETDGTKRALSTFGRPFGLELYRNGKPTTAGQSVASNTPEIAAKPVGLHPDDLTPIPRPSQYYGRPRDPIAQELGNERRGAQKALQQQQQAKQPQSLGSLNGPAPTLIPEQPTGIDKSALTIGEPKRLRDKAHLKFVAAKPCLVCGRQPSDPHHLRFAQPRAIGMKVSDEFTVPLCRGHHRQLHQVGNEQAWWTERNVAPLPIARQLWEQTHPKVAAADQSSETTMGGT